MIVGLSSNSIDTSTLVRGIDGIGVYTRSLEKSLRACNVVTQRIGAPALNGLRWTRPTEANMSFSLPLDISNAWSSVTGFSAPFSARVENAIDVYHATDYRAPRLARTPVVATIYDAISLRNPLWVGSRLRGLKNWLIRNSADSADRVIAISHAAIDEIEEYFHVPRDRIRVAYPAIADEWFSPVHPNAFASLAKKWGLRSNYFLFVGTLQPRKNIAALVEAYQRLPDRVRIDHQLLIVGRFGWGVESLRDQLRALTKAGQVIWMERVDYASLRAIYSNASVFVFPTLAEGFGLPMIEALASGLPVIASDLPVLREVGGAEVSFFSSGECEALVDALQTGLSARRDIAAIASRKVWAQQFSMKASGVKVRQIYSELLSR